MIKWRDRYYYIVLNYKDENGKRKQPWISTGILEEKGNKRKENANKNKAEKMLYAKIAEHENTHIDLTNSTLYVDFLTEWLDALKGNGTVRQNTYHQYELLVNNANQG